MSDPNIPEWAQNDWEKALEQGIITDKSLPNSPVTKAELIVILTRAGIIK